tara:strand:- start:55 stop:477 length:423 start_codon:yes stop_codon:yes gene_type:complete
MLNKIFSKKTTKILADENNSDLLLRLMFEIAMSDGKLDNSELALIKKRAEDTHTEDIKVSDIIKKIIDESEQSVSFYPTVLKINNEYSQQEKKDLLKILWELVTADSVVDVYEENLYFKIADLLKIKRVIANQIKQQNSD